MKKRALSLVLALALCLGLAVPAIAVDTSGLDANEAKAFYDVLSSCGKTKVVEFADVKDMDADGVPELIAVVFDVNATVEIWQLKDGKAVKVTNELCFSGINGSIGYCTKNGKPYICTNAEKWGDISISDDKLITIGGVYERLSYYGDHGGAEGTVNEYGYTIGGKTSDITQTQYSQLLSTFPQSDDIFLEWSGWMGSVWMGVYDGKHGPSYQTVLNQLNAKAKETPSASGFADVKSNAYYADAVKWAVDKNITTGTGANTFSPDQTCTVAQILTFLWRANGSPEPTSRNPFGDIQTSDYYYKAALWARSKGLVSASNFNPNAACTRAMVVTYLWKLAGSPTDQKENYKPLTFTETMWDGSTCAVTFDAAVVKKMTVTLCEDQPGSNGVSHSIMEDESDPLIVVPAGSRIKIDNPSGEEMPWGRDGLDAKWYYSDQAGVYHSEPGVSSTDIGSGEEIIPNAVCSFYMGGTHYYVMAASSSNHFSDVPVSADYAQAVAWAVNQKITSGTSATTFTPAKTCTRGEIVTFLHRAMG